MSWNINLEVKKITHLTYYRGELDFLKIEMMQFILLKSYNLKEWMAGSCFQLWLFVFHNFSCEMKLRNKSELNSPLPGDGWWVSVERSAMLCAGSKNYCWGQLRLWLPGNLLLAATHPTHSKQYQYWHYHDLYRPPQPSQACKRNAASWGFYDFNKNWNKPLNTNTG